MTSSFLSLIVFMFFLALAGGRNCRAQQAPDQRPDFSELLRKIEVYGPDECGPGDATTWNSGGIENSLFSEAANAVVQELNASAATSPRERAVQALTALQKLSASTNAAWPDENRFHFEMFELPPALVVKLSIRTQAEFLVFGRTPERDGRPGGQWRRIWTDADSINDYVPQRSVDIYPLHRGPSGNVRFLAYFTNSGCAGSFGVSYAAFEWNGKDASAMKILEQEGSFGLEAPKLFPLVGKLRTKGALVTVPYCWDSAIDWWDNPSLCSVDTYDLSGDDVLFRSRIYNRPDLVPIAKAIEYAGTHDFQAVRGYCGSDDIAHRLVREVPGVSGSSDPKVVRIGAGRERIAFDDSGSHFDVEKRPGGWVITDFGTD